MILQCVIQDFFKNNTEKLPTFPNKSKHITIRKYKNIAGSNTCIKY